MFSAVHIVTAFTKCYQANGQEYCFYTNSSVTSWDKAREFCVRRNSTLPIITDETIDNVFQQFMFDSNYDEVGDADTNEMDIHVWLGAHANPVDESEEEEWHWINGQLSG